MTGEPTHTALKWKEMVPDLLFSSECQPQLSITEICREVDIMLHFQLQKIAFPFKYCMSQACMCTQE